MKVLKIKMDGLDDEIDKITHAHLDNNKARWVGSEVMREIYKRRVV